MFYLYHHHDLSRLADVLTALRRTNAQSPLATDCVLVPNMGLGRWLKMHIAERDGISANISTALPAPFFWQLVADSLPGDRPDSSAYRRENLRWHLYALLPTLANHVPEVGNYLAGTSPELRRWQLAEQLAGLFDQYLIYRREMLLDWELGEDVDTPPANWQAPVWRLLVTHLGPNHRARLLGEFVQRTGSGAPLNYGRWPERLYCFGLGNLPPDYLRLLYATAGHTDVHFLMHFATIYVEGDDLRTVAEHLEALEGIEVVLGNAEACRRFELPNDRVGDLVVVSTRHVVLGTSASRHDLSGLDAPLRSHGGISEQVVPLLFNRRATEMTTRRLRNFDVLDIALNHLEARAVATAAAD